MAPSDQKIIQFYKLLHEARVPQRADRSAAGTLPTRAYRYCEAVTSASAFGWWVFPPIDLHLMWDGSDIFWTWDQAVDWQPLLPSAQLPDFPARFDDAAPQEIKGCSPPFLTALPEPGTLQIWTGLLARTAPGWHLLVRAPANLAGPGGVVLYEGIVETDRWFGPLFANLRFTRSHSPIRLRADFPLVLAQPVAEVAYSEAVLSSMSVIDDLAGLRDTDWADYHRTIVVPNQNPDRAFGAYAVNSRQRRRQMCPHSQAAHAEIGTV